MTIGTYLLSVSFLGLLLLLVQFFKARHEGENRKTSENDISTHFKSKLNFGFSNK